MVQNESFVAYNNQMMHKKSSLSNWIKHKYMYKAKLTRTNSKPTAKWTPSTNILPSQHYPVCSNMMPFYLLKPFWPDSNCVLAKRFLICCMYSDFRSATFSGLETLGEPVSLCFSGLLDNGGVSWPPHTTSVRVFTNSVNASFSSLFFFASFGSFKHLATGRIISAFVQAHFQGFCPNSVLGRCVFSAVPLFQVFKFCLYPFLPLFCIGPPLLCFGAISTSSS